MARRAKKVRLVLEQEFLEDLIRWNSANLLLTALWLFARPPSHCIPRRPSRQSQQVVEYGTFILEGGHLKKLGDDTWSFLEQVGIAALDLGRWELAEVSGVPAQARALCGIYVSDVSEEPVMKRG